MDKRVSAAIDAVTPKTAALFSEEDAHGIIAFLRTGAGQRLMHHSAAAAETAWEATPSGHAFLTQASEFSSLIQGTMQRNFADLGPLMGARIAHDICAVMENECPDSIRHAVSAQ